MLLGIGSLSCLILGAIAYVYCRSALETRVTQQLTSLRDSRATQIESYIDGVRRHVASLGADLAVVEAFNGFRDAIDGIESSGDSDTEPLIRYYETAYLPAIREIEAGEPILDNFVPASPAARRLQARYLLPAMAAASGDYPAGLADGDERVTGTEAYNEVHRRFGPMLSAMRDSLGYYDLFLVDAETLDVVYTCSKEPDFATNLRNGPYSDSSLARAVTRAAGSPNRSFVAIEDFQFYLPSHGDPAAFVATPVYDGNRRVAVLAMQLPIDEINRIMTGDRQWDASGLGDTGETILVGGDRTMRSDARMLLEEPDEYVEALQTTRLSPTRIKRIADSETTILLRPVENEAVEEAFRGKSGYQVVEHFRGYEALSCYRPLAFEDLDWILLAEMEAREAFAPLTDLRRTLLLSSAGLLLASTILAMLLASGLTRPIDRFIEGCRRVARGQADELEIKARDEFGELAGEINSLVGKLRGETESVNLHTASLMATIGDLVPPHTIDDLLDRDAEGEKQSIHSHKSVAVVSIRFDNFPGISAARGMRRRITLLNDLTVMLDEMLDEHRIEKVKSDGHHYTAACGIAVPRMDAARRVTDFAAEVREKLEFFNQKNNTELAMTAGIDLGPAMSGFIGHRNLVFDLWGEPVGDCIAIHRDVPPGTIRLTADAREQLGDVFDFEPVDAPEGDDPAAYDLVEKEQPAAAS